jgi:hypothetical protein
MLRFARASSPIIIPMSLRLGGTQGRNHVPNRLRAYIFAERKSQSPDMAPSGVRHDMFVDFMTCFKYSRGSLGRHSKSEKRTGLRVEGNARYRGADIYPVLPFKLGPHATELGGVGIEHCRCLHAIDSTDLGLVAIGWLDVVHDIDVDVIQDDACFRQVRSFPENAAKDDAGFCG